MSSLNEKRMEHPSFGAISFSRSFNGEAIPLFGSSIKSRSTIVLTINEAELCRTLSNDHVHPRKKIIEVEMSESQFAQLITSLNCGDGNPCTITYRADKGGYVEACPFTDKRQEFEQEFKDTQAENRQQYNEFEKFVKGIMEKKTIGKGDREEIMRQFSIMRGKLFNNQEFVYNQFNEQMDKTVTEAKGEIEAFMQTRLMAAAGIDVEKKDDDMKALDHVVEI